MKPYPEGGAKALPFALGILAVAAAWLFYPERPKQAPYDSWGVADPIVQKKLAYDGRRRFEDLTPKNQAFVRENYKALLLAQEKRDFQTMSERARNILSLIDEYNDTKSYEAIAKRGLDLVEEERRRKILEEKQAKIREEVVLLEKAGAEIATHGFRDRQSREAMENLIQEIYSKDPNNRMAAEWKREMFRVISEENREKTRMDLANLEIKGQGLVKKAKRNPASRAELYRVMDEIRSIDSNNAFVEQWKKDLLKE